MKYNFSCYQPFKKFGNMESLQVDPILEFNHDTLKSLRKEYNFEKKEEMDAAIDVFEEWLKKQNHFTKKEYPREYLERLIIHHKGSVERAKIHMDKLCTLRTLLPNFFEHYDVRSACVPFIRGASIQVFLPKLTANHHRVYIAKLNDVKLSPNFFMKIYIMCTIFSEYITGHDYSNGIISIVDVRDINILDIVKELNLFELRQMVTIGMDGFGFRIKGIHMLTSSPMIDALTKIFKQMFSAKIGNRIFVHRTVESLSEIVSKDVLPIEYGGTEKSLNIIHDKWIDTLSTKEFMEHIKVMNQARTIESLRVNDAVKDQYSGIAGTFRTLSVD